MQGAVARVLRPLRRGAGAGAWGLGLGLGLGLVAGARRAAGCEQDEPGEPAAEEKLPPPRAFSRAAERSRDLLQRIKVRVGLCNLGSSPGGGGSVPRGGPARPFTCLPAFLPSCARTKWAPPASWSACLWMGERCGAKVGAEGAREGPFPGLDDGTRSRTPSLRFCPLFFQVLPFGSVLCPPQLRPRWGEVNPFCSQWRRA